MALRLETGSIASKFCLNRTPCALPILVVRLLQVWFELGGIWRDSIEFLFEQNQNLVGYGFGLDWIGLDWVGADWIGLDFDVVSLDVVRF